MNATSSITSSSGDLIPHLSFSIGCHLQKIFLEIPTGVVVFCPVVTAWATPTGPFPPIGVFPVDLVSQREPRFSRPSLLTPCRRHLLSRPTWGAAKLLLTSETLQQRSSTSRRGDFQTHEGSHQTLREGSGV